MVLNDKFHFLTILAQLEVFEITRYASNLIEIYTEDFENSFIKECIDFRGHLQHIEPELENQGNNTAFSVFELIQNHKIKLFLGYISRR